MNEKELAAELHASKDDATEWGEPEATPSSSERGKTRLAAMVSVRFAPDELKLVQRRAQEGGQTVSAYLRSLAVRDLRGPSLFSAFGVTISTSGTYSAHVGNPWLMSDGRRLATSQG